MAFKCVNNNDDTLTVEDPIYGTIMIPNPFSRIVLSKEMQRLNDISQNGFAQYEFKGLENNDRLSHSVGAFYVMGLILDRIESILKHYDIEISKDDRDIALCSILLHDIGHGPFSHSFEVVTNYSHEKRTSDILLGDTEIGNLLVELFGKQKVRKIASFIAEINDHEELSGDSFTKLLKNLVSHQLDADRIDYLVRDSYYVGIPSSIDMHRIISNLSVAVNNNREYELLIHRDGLSSIENILIRRYQMYRDVYLGPTSVLGDEILKLILDRYRKNPALHSLPVSEYFRVLASDPTISNLDDFVGMTDIDLKVSFRVLMGAEDDPLVAYLSNLENLGNYILIENDVPIDKIKIYLTDIFGDINLSDTLSVLDLKMRNKLYKREESLNIQYRNRIADLTECTNLIRPQEMLENRYIFFNPTLLRIELGLTEEEFKKYEGELSKMLADLNKKPEEFELKYIVNSNEGNDSLLERIISVFSKYGFRVVSKTERQNNDEYYDTRNLDLYQSGGSLRIRKSVQGEKTKFKGTFKTPVGEGEVYSSRTEIEEQLISSDFDQFEATMRRIRVLADFNQILRSPILNSTTSRMDVVLEKNGVQVCLSLDNSVYTNHPLDDIMTSDRMIEIEAIGKISDRIILNEIHDFITGEIYGLTINKQSKYERGVDSTSLLYAHQQSQGSCSQSPKSMSGVQALIKRLGDSDKY